MNTMQRTAKRFKKSEWRDIMLKQITTDEFIKRARKVHGDKYDYSKSVYVGALKKLIVICKEHGEFLVIASDHLNKKTGCSKCAGKHTPTPGEFIKLARKVHGDKYDYSKTTCVRLRDKTTIICPIHGEFLQSPKNHLRSTGCDKCNIITTEEFVQRAKQIHGDRYDYSKTEYISSRKKVIIKCSVHGEFLQEPHAHVIIKSGCYKCGCIEGGKKTRSTHDVFIERAKNVHGDKYDYSRVNYTRMRDKIIIICPKHGNFKQGVNNHIVLKQGCPKCFNETRGLNQHKITTEEFITRAKKIHGDKYDYSESICYGSCEKVYIRCPIHGIFRQMATKHLRGQGCRKCISKISKSEIEFLNYLKIPNECRQCFIDPYYVDGINKNVVYEFLGDYWHGNPKTQDPSMINYQAHATFGDLYIKTKNRFNVLCSKGYTIKYIWESDWKNWKKTKIGKIPIKEYNSLISF